jgi:hypothetical protein
MSKEHDYFEGSTKDVMGDVITHPSWRRSKRAKLRKPKRKGAFTAVIPRRKKSK